LNKKLSCRTFQLFSSFSLLLALPLQAEIRVFDIFLKDHLFNPTTLYVPAGEKVKLVIHNQDPTPEEFESFSLNREKVILGNGKGVVFIGPLQPGEHPFIGEYNPDNARGTIVVLPFAQWQEKSTAITQANNSPFLQDSTDNSAMKLPNLMPKRIEVSNAH